MTSATTIMNGQLQAMDFIYHFLITLESSKVGIAKLILPLEKAWRRPVDCISVVYS